MDLADLAGHAVSDSEPPNTVKSLAEDIDQAAIDRAPAGHHAVARDDGIGHAGDPSRGGGRTYRIPRSCRDLSSTSSRSPGGELALLMLGGDALFATAQPCPLAALVQRVDDLMHGGQSPASALRRPSSFASTVAGARRCHGANFAKLQSCEIAGFANGTEEGVRRRQGRRRGRRPG